MGKGIVTVTCDWDGLDYPLHAPYNPDNAPHFRFARGIQAIQHFNALFDDRIPLTHFICPVYCTRSKLLTEHYAGEIAALTKNSNCEVGLHIHGWMSLMRACGVSPRDPVKDHSVPDWGEQPGDRFGLSVSYENDAGEMAIDYGHGVPMGVYRRDEIMRLLEQGRELIVATGIINSREACLSFRSGGWMCNDAVFQALQSTAPPFQFEASAVDASFFAARNGLLDHWLAQLWGAEDQPEDSYLANRLFRSAYANGINVLAHGNEVSAAQPKILGSLLEIPDTAILADYVDADYMKAQIDGAAATAERQTDDVYVSLGFHLESGGDPRRGKVFGHIEEVVAALEYVKQKYTAGEVQYLTIPEAGRRFLRSNTSGPI